MVTKKTKFAVDLMMDSGIFSAWNRGKSLNLLDYIKYVKDNKHLLWSYVNMDEIPGKFGQKRTQRDVDESAEISYYNLQTMKSHGLHPIPVFHQGERFTWLEQLLKDGEDYIGISSAKDLNRPAQQTWLDQVFSILCDRRGRPIIKTHGFGISRVAFLLRYPWWSSDSTTWSLTPGYGSILIPPWDGRKFDYSRPACRCVTSGVQQTGATLQKRQFEAWGPQQQAIVLRYLAEIGVTLEEARYSTQQRRRCVLHYYLQLQKHLDGVNFRGHGKAKSEGMPPFRTNIVYATMLDKAWGQLMNELGARTRLLSYWEMRDQPSEVLARYVETGTHGPWVPQAPKQSWKSEAYRNYRRAALHRRGTQDGEETTA